MTAPERAGRPGDQALPAVDGGQDVFADAIAHLEARRAIGVRRYGRALHTENGRDAGRDELEEFLDGFIYRWQLRLERMELEERFRRAVRGWKFCPWCGKPVPEAARCLCPAWNDGARR